ncbi:MAG: GNAT family N-acetyltransferase [Micromonosporaceae bacterium]|nr:GNAT family N-acetyltransferase [Micromonosporaceae bacterium]
MTGALGPIRRATPDDVPAIAVVVAEAFHPLRASQWLVPDPVIRRVTMAAQFAILIEHALAFGHVDLLADGSAAAVWFDRTKPMPAPPDYDRRLTVGCGEHAAQFRVLDALFEQHHPADPHHHLAMLAVAGDRQGGGRGTLLLRHHHHQVLDDQGIPAYLEAASIRSARLYYREGYRPRAEPFALPNEAFFYPMWRTAGQGSAETGTASPPGHLITAARLSPSDSGADLNLAHPTHRTGRPSVTRVRAAALRLRWQRHAPGPIHPPHHVRLQSAGRRR